MLYGVYGDSGFMQALKRSSSIKLSPNPANDIVTISFTGPESVGDIEVFDVTGRLIQNIPAREVSSDVDFHMNVNSYPAGIYFLKTIDENGISYQKQLAIEH